ncbi:MAG: class I SAM-dependent methyltransferase, partial [bacterium]|nr:class I SAM-dependent methyltransferase [bacterium]
NSMVDTTGATEFDEMRWKDKSQRIVFRHEAALSLIGAQDKEILDIGCGDGLLVRLITEKYGDAQCTGVDFSHNAIARARAGVPKADFKVVDAVSASLPFHDNAFDVVIALDVFEHVLMPEKLLAEMKRVSKRGVVVGVPNFSSLPARLQVLLGKVPENNRPGKGHVYWFNHYVLGNLLRADGLRIKKVRTNYPWARVPVVGAVIGALLRVFPNAFALSFIIYAEK